MESQQTKKSKSSRKRQRHQSSPEKSVLNKLDPNGVDFVESLLETKNKKIRHAEEENGDPMSIDVQESATNEKKLEEVGEAQNLDRKCSNARPPTLFYSPDIADGPNVKLKPRPRLSRDRSHSKSSAQGRANDADVEKIPIPSSTTFAPCKPNNEDEEAPVSATPRDVSTGASTPTSAPRRVRDMTNDYEADSKDKIIRRFGTMMEDAIEENEAQQTALVAEKAKTLCGKCNQQLLTSTSINVSVGTQTDTELPEPSHGQEVTSNSSNGKAIHEEHDQSIPITVVANHNSDSSDKDKTIDEGRGTLDVILEEDEEEDVAEVTEDEGELEKESSEETENIAEQPESSEDTAPKNNRCCIV